MSNGFFGVILLLLVSGCQSKQPDTGFYYWKTTLDFSTKDHALFAQLGAQRLYLRFFDVNWNAEYQMAVPVGVLKPKPTAAPLALDQMAIVPTVFIVNRVFELTPPDQLAALAQKTAAKIKVMAKRLGFSSNLPIRAIQIDCDWTAKTRDPFFQFLRFLQKEQPQWALSCTVRLHQYRDRQLMGIPPVSNALLMCYNTGNVKMRNEENAILDAAVVAQYLKGRPYPLPLDVALPLFSWGAWYRGTKFLGLLGSIELGLAKKSTFLTLRARPNHFRVIKDTVFQGNYLRLGDEVRVDGSSDEAVKATLDLLQHKLKKKINCLLWFDWEYERVEEKKKLIEQTSNGL